MIDIHSHILHEIDDGAQDVSEAIALCDIARRQGITGIVATPHFAEYDRVDDFLRVRDNRIEQLKIAVEERGFELELTAGCELYLDEYIFSAPSLDGVTINNSRYMLCEFSLAGFDCDEALAWIDELIRRGYTPILAHPERYSVFLRTPEFLNEFVNRGILFQVNADSLTGGNGKGCFYLACDMLKLNLVDFIGSDAHSPKYRPNDLMDKIGRFPSFIENDTLELLLDENPARVIADKTIKLPERGIV